MSRALRREVQRGGALLHSIDVVPKFLTVVHSSYVIPGAQRMQALPVEQSLLDRSGLGEGIQTPAVIDHPDFEQHPVIVLSFLEMKPALLGSAAVRT